jgi:hypothetical protein
MTTGRDGGRLTQHEGVLFLALPAVRILATGDEGLPMWTWVLVQIDGEPMTFVGVLPWCQFTRDVQQARRFKDKRDAEDYVRDICFDWPHKPRPIAVEVTP